MVVDIDLNTGQRTIVKPLNAADKEKLAETFIGLYRLNENRKTKEAS